MDTLQIKKAALAFPDRDQLSPRLLLSTLPTAHPPRPDWGHTQTSSWLFYDELYIGEKKKKIAEASNPFQVYHLFDSNVF